MRRRETIAVTSVERSLLADIANIALVTDDGTASHHLDNFASRTVHVALLAALHQATAQHLTDPNTPGRRAAATVAQHQR